MRTFFSIIIPTLNSADKISKAIESVLQQTFTSFEVLIVDGLSTDNTVAIANGFQDERIRIFSERDAGIYDAMNKGISRAKGEWVYFLGSDDYLYNNKVLEAIYLDSLKMNCDVIYGNAFVEVYNQIYDGQFDKEKILEKNICHQAIFLKREMFARIGYFDMRFKSLADWDHNMRWFLSKTVKIKYVDLVIAYYAHGGFSSFNRDQFVKVKRLQYLKHGRGILTFKEKMKVFRDELYVKRKEKKIREFPQLLKYLFYVFY